MFEGELCNSTSNRPVPHANNVIIGQVSRDWLPVYLVLPIGGIPTSLPTVLSIALAIGPQQFAKYKAIVTRIEGLVAITILYSDKTGTLTANKLTIDRPTISTYGPLSLKDATKLAAYVSCTENQDTIGACTVGSIPDLFKAHTSIKVLDFNPFNPVNKRTEVTYHEESTGKLKRVTKGMTGIIVELCSCNKTEIENRLEADAEEFTMRPHYRF